MFEDRKPRPFHDIPVAERIRPVLKLGRVVATPGALEALTLAGETGESYLRRHVCGDWGSLDTHDWTVNDCALEEGTRILSCYALPTGEELWVITEWDRAVTTLLLPEEY